VLGNLSTLPRIEVPVNPRCDARINFGTAALLRPFWAKRAEGAFGVLPFSGRTKPRGENPE